MRHTTLWTFLLSSWIPFSLANSQIRPPSNPFPEGNLFNSSNPLEVNLGYAGYAGVYDVSNSLNYWYGSTPQPTQPVGSEGCLFLNVWAPENATDLQVFVWIHGGGYGYGNAQFDMPFLLKATVNKYVIADIQYRLGAFGFLAGDEVYKHGTTNAGLYDQYLALQWVQRYISHFGGDHDRVTIGGISAGAGSVMLQSMAYGGAVGDELLDTVWTASPYLPQQWNYNDPLPATYFDQFATAAGCADGTNFEDTFHCLVEQDTQVLMDTNWISHMAPNTDNKIVQQRPSEQLVKGNLNGNCALTGNNANEGEIFTDEQFESVLAQYSIPADIPTVRFATDGLNKNATANFNLYAETTLDCPAYWMAEGFSMNGRQSYKYQFSIINSLHGEDETVCLNTFGPVNYLAPSFRDPCISMLDSVFTTGTPNDSSSYSSDVPADVAAVLSSWPSYTVDKSWQAILNQTGGTMATSVDLGDAYAYDITNYIEPGLAPFFTLANAYNWEDGREAGCEFWKSVGAMIPEQ
ncbi:hypothetical protein ZTR_01369 [Talaromyces verruculosus]|nr:hypothetical protein ZTR_01369 [Talaromyces verruculosus]